MRQTGGEGRNPEDDYTGGHVRSIKPGLFSRKWAFRDNGRAAALAHGTRLEAAACELVALAGGGTIEVFQEGEPGPERPEWVVALDRLPEIPEAAAGRPAGAE